MAKINGTIVDDYKRVEAHVQVASALLDNVEKAIKKYTGKGVSSEEFIKNHNEISTLLDLSIKYSKQYAEITGLVNFVEKAVEQADKLRKGSEISPVETILGSNPAVFEATITDLCKQLGFSIPDNVLNIESKKKNKKSSTNESSI